MTQQAPSLLPVRSDFLPIDLWGAPRPPQAGGPKPALHRFYLQLPTGPRLDTKMNQSIDNWWDLGKREGLTAGQVPQTGQEKLPSA